MKLTATEIPDVIVIEPKVFGDDRGYFLESHNEKRYREAGIVGPFVQDNVSKSKKGVLRGLHFQDPKCQGKLVMALEGVIFDVAVDIRKGSSTFGNWVGATIHSDKKQQIWVPPGFAHGFLVLSDFALIQYKCTEYYAPECEHSILWNDPDIGIQWPMTEGIELSAKDKVAKRLRDVVT